MLISRRAVLSSPAALPLLRPALSSPDSAPNSSRLKVVVTGGHPGDPECGCAGTVARYSAQGHQVVLLYMNRGEGFCKGAKAQACGDVRTLEAQKACEILRARPAFAGQVDGRATVDNTHYDAFGRLLDAEKPDIVFSQWPIDQHRDHRALSTLVLDAWLRSGRRFGLYYYEVAVDTQMFSPTEYVDISAPELESRRRAACYAHSSQVPDHWYPAQVELTRFRGSAGGYPQAEAFLRHWQSRSFPLP